MKRMKGWMLALLLAGGQLHAQGTWQGRAGAVRVILHEGVKTTMDMPERQMNGLQPDSILHPAKDSLVLVFPHYVGRIALKRGAQVMHGALYLDEGIYPLTLVSVKTIQPLALPQAPKLPLPYTVKQVTYKHDTIRFGATLTLPAGKGPHTAVILLSGTGKQDRNGLMAGHPMFTVLADFLTRRGYVVLRSDDRGTGASGGVYETTTQQEFAGDVKAAMRYLQTLPQVDAHRIGLIGHSEGGAIAFMAAADNRDIAFVITLAGLASKGLESLRWQNRELISKAPIPAIRKQRFNNLNEVMFQAAYTYAGSDSLEQHLRSAYAAWNVQDSALARRDTTNGHFFYPLESYIRQATGAWYRSNIRFDPAPYLEAVHAPILAFNGDKDLFVAPASLHNIDSLARAGGNKDVTVQLMPGVNHLQQHCQTCTVSESLLLDETIAPGILRVMDAWLKKHSTNH